MKGYLTIKDKTVELLGDLEEYLSDHKPCKEINTVFLMRIKSIKEQLEVKNENMS